MVYVSYRTHQLLLRARDEMYRLHINARTYRPEILYRLQRPGQRLTNDQMWCAK